MNARIFKLTILATLLGWQVTASASDDSKSKQSKSTHPEITTLIGEEYRINTFLSASQIQAIVDKAKGGDANAALKLAFYYQKPAFSQPNMEKSLHWMNEAYQLGHPEAMFHLALHHQSGEHLPKDLDKALSYYAQAVMVDHPHAYTAIAKVLADSETKATQLEQLAKQFSTHSPSRTGNTLYKIGRIFIEDNEIKEDQNFAMHTYQLAIKHGSIAASYFYAKRKWLKPGKNYDFEKALPLIKPYASNNTYISKKMSWELCTSGDPQLRHPSHGLAFISQVDIYDNDYAKLDTLAACHAAVGNFDKAIKMQQRIVNALTANHQPLEGYGKRLALYLKGEKYIEDEYDKIQREKEESKEWAKING